MKIIAINDARFMIDYEAWVHLVAPYDDRSLCGKMLKVMMVNVPDTSIDERALCSACKVEEDWYTVLDDDAL